jgi:uncharacterized protein (DUF111 family)
MAVWADGFVPPARITPAMVGIGLGHRELDRPNLVRLLLGTDDPELADPELVDQELRDIPR